jgi:uncharacterized protein YndB with AHSA1/START domain
VKTGHGTVTKTSCYDRFDWSGLCCGTGKDAVNDGDYEIVELRPSELIAFQVIAGPARPTGTYRFEPVGGATRVTFTLHFEPKGLARLIDPMITSTMRSEVATLTNLKAYLEGQM